MKVKNRVKMRRRDRDDYVKAPRCKECGLITQDAYAHERAAHGTNRRGTFN